MLCLLVASDVRRGGGDWPAQVLEIRKKALGSFRSLPAPFHYPPSSWIPDICPYNVVFLFRFYTNCAGKDPWCRDAIGWL